ncbi:MAG: hypothetical protein Q8R92_04505 [Deltaproteobacteria bacterium]|nr:hypothetical protein [Deltaproteobacteria bacterium]
MRGVLKQLAFNLFLALAALGVIWLGGITLVNHFTTGAEIPSASGLVFLLILSLPLALLACVAQVLSMMLISRTQMGSHPALLRAISMVVFLGAFMAGQPARDLVTSRTAVAPFIIAILTYGLLHQLPRRRLDASRISSAGSPHS